MLVRLLAKHPHLLDFRTRFVSASGICIRHGNCESVLTRARHSFESVHLANRQFLRRWRCTQQGLRFRLRAISLLLPSFVLAAPIR